MTVRLVGANLIIVGGRKDSVVIIENNLPYQTLGIAKPPVRKIEEFAEIPILASLVQKEFEANQAEATKKYGNNFVLLKGKVGDFGDDLEIQTIKPKTTPSKTPSPSSTPYSRTKQRTRRKLLDSITNMLSHRQRKHQHPPQLPAKLRFIILLLF